MQVKKPVSNTEIKNRITKLLLKESGGEILGHVEFLELCGLFKSHPKLYYQISSNLKGNK